MRTFWQIWLSLASVQFLLRKSYDWHATFKQCIKPHAFCATQRRVGKPLSGQHKRNQQILYIRKCRQSKQAQIQEHSVQLIQGKKTEDLYCQSRQNSTRPQDTTQPKTLQPEERKLQLTSNFIKWDIHPQSGTHLLFWLFCWETVFYYAMNVYACDPKG